MANSKNLTSGTTMLNTLIQYCNIMLDIQREGKEHLEILKEMKMLCAFQGEIQSGSIQL